MVWLPLLQQMTGACFFTGSIILEFCGFPGAFSRRSMSWKQDLISVQVLVPGEGKMGMMYLNGTKTVKRVIRTTVIMLTVFLMPVFADTDDSVPVSSGLAIMHEEEFGGVYLGLTIEEFNSLGYAYGDSVTVRFSNGYELPGIPYYNGYYAQNGDALLVAYPGYPYIKACIQTGDDLWVMAGLKEGDTAEASLAVRGEYLDIQTAWDIHYEDDRTLFASDSVFANFRSITAGDIQENYLYRSASPCDNQHNRAPFADGLIAEAGVKYIVDLADNEAKIQGCLNDPAFSSPYFRSLYEAGEVCPVSLNANFGSDEFGRKLVFGLKTMTDHPGPYLIHCLEGKDRTGFVCMLLEALCGASYQEIVDDYMISYDNYYQISKENDPGRYEVIRKNVLDPMVSIMIGEDIAPEKADLTVCAENYLVNAGMSRKMITALRQNLSGAE